MIRREDTASLVCGFLFALGLGVSGMTQPSRVVGFLDVFGDWDPSLIFVMAGAVLVYAIGYQRVRKQQKPIFASQFQIPSNRNLDSSLIVGSALFGVGWGIAGFCPGPAITSLMAFGKASLLFVGSMFLTMFLYEKWWLNRGKL